MDSSSVMRIVSVTRWLWKYILAHPLQSIFILVTSIVEPVFYMYPLFVSADIINEIMTNPNFKGVFSYFAVLIPVVLIQIVLFFSSSFMNEILAHRITTDMTYDLFDTLQSRSQTYHDNKDIGEIMARATNDTRAVNMSLNPGIRMIIATVVIWMVGAYILNTINPLFNLILIAVFIIFLILTAIYSLKLNPLSTKVLEELSLISAITSDSLTGIIDVKTYVAESLFRLKFTRQTIKQELSKEKEGTLGAWFYPDLFLRTIILVLITYSLYLTYNNALSYGDLLLVVTAFGLVAGMSEEMEWVSFILVGGYSAAARLYDFIHEVDDYFMEDGDQKFNGPASIEFKNVTFRYKNQEAHAIKNVSFKINDGETVAIVGGPGSGKSTITKLIQRLYIPEKGQILLGDKPLNAYNNNDLRKHISTVEQDIALFNDTILENIRFGRPEATLDEVIQVAKIAQAHEFIMSFPKQYNTLIGDNGVRLSGGQKQRIAICRALLINPSILIFDDGASALDSRTELKIQHAISKILDARTTVITTHRLAIIAKSDKILIMQNGTVVGFGTHTELILNNKYYRQLFENFFELPPMEVK